MADVRELEHKLNANDAHAKHLKGQYFEKHVDRYNTVLKTTNNEAIYNRALKLRQAALDKVNKYKGTSYKS